MAATMSDSLLVVDAGTPGARGREEKLQKPIRVQCLWVSMVLCQFHQGDLLMSSIFEIPEYADALAKSRQLKVFMRAHLWSRPAFASAGGPASRLFDNTQILYTSLHCGGMVRDKDFYIAALHGTVYMVPYMWTYIVKLEELPARRGWTLPKCCADE